MESIPTPSRVVPSKNETDPVGVPAEEEIVAVKLMGAVTSAGFAEDASVTVAVALFTTRLTESVTVVSSVVSVGVKVAVSG